MDSPSAIALMNLLGNLSRLFQFGKEKVKEKDPLAVTAAAMPSKSEPLALQAYDKDMAIMCLSFVAIVAIIAVVVIALSRQSA